MNSLLLNTNHLTLRRIGQRSVSRLLPTASSLQPYRLQQPQQQQPEGVGCRRWLATPKKKPTKKKKAIRGSRGSRGHGWYVKYREGRGGRHLQGEYFDRTQHHYNLQQWNDAVLSLGSQFVYLDIAVEPPQEEGQQQQQPNDNTKAAVLESEDGEEEIDISAPASSEEEEEEASSENTEADAAAAKAEETPIKDEKKMDDEDLEEEDPVKIERLIIQVASTVLPETCINFIGLCQESAYKDSILYRIEKQVGLCGGDYLTNTGRTGQCWQSFPPYENSSTSSGPRPHPMRRNLPPPSEEPMALWHTAGTVTMLCPKVNEIDSRFILCCQDSPHLDGIHRAFGMLQPQSLEVVKEWQSSVITANGKPRSAILRIVDCGIWDENTMSTTAATAPEETSNEDAEPGEPKAVSENA